MKKGSSAIDGPMLFLVIGFVSSMLGATLLVSLSLALLGLLMVAAWLLYQSQRLLLERASVNEIESLTLISEALATLRSSGSAEDPIEPPRSPDIGIEGAKWFMQYHDEGASILRRFDPVEETNAANVLATAMLAEQGFSSRTVPSVLFYTGRDTGRAVSHPAKIDGPQLAHLEARARLQAKLIEAINRKRMRRSKATADDEGS